MATTIIEKVLPSNLQFLNSKNEVYTLEIGNRTKSVQRYNPTSHSERSTTFNFNTPSSKVVMGRRLMLRTQITVVAAGGSFGTNFAPRQWGPMAACRAVDLTINGGKSHSNPSELLPMFGRFHTSAAHRARFMTGVPSKPDIGEMSRQLAYEVYAAAGAGVAPGAIWDTAKGGGAGVSATLSLRGMSYPNNDSPFSQDGRCNGEPSRAWDGWYTEATAGTRVYTFYTPVFCSPLSWNSSVDGLGNVSKVELRLDWESSLIAKMFNDMDGASVGRNIATVGALSHNFDVSEPQLIVEYSDPLVEIPPALAFDHVELQTDVKQIGAIASTNLIANQQNTTQFMDIVPSQVYIFIRERASVSDITHSNIYAGLTGLKLRYDNIEYNYDETQLATLWQQSVNNGLDMSWPEWIHSSVDQSNKVGSIVCLQFGKDIPLPPGVFPGSPKKSSLTVTVNGVNNHANGYTFDLYTVLAYNSRYIIRENAAQVVIGLTPDEQAQLEGAPMSEADAQNPHDIVGGGFGKWKRFAHKIGSVASTIYKNRDAIEGAYNQGKDVYQQGKDIIGTIRSVQKSAPDSMQGGLLIGGTMVGGGVRSRFM